MTGPGRLLISAQPPRWADHTEHRPAWFRLLVFDEVDGADNQHGPDQSPHHGEDAKGAAADFHHATPSFFCS